MITPCISICVIDPETELCEGCGRTLDEISNWSRMTADQRNAVMAELKARRQERDAALA